MATILALTAIGLAFGLLLAAGLVDYFDRSESGDLL